MKFKTLAIVALSGLLATSFAFADADDMDLADNTTGMMSGDNNVGSMQPQSGTAMAAPTSGNIGNPNADSMNSDDMSADTATGDDDY